MPRSRRVHGENMREPQGRWQLLRFQGCEGRILTGWGDARNLHEGIL